MMRWLKSISLVGLLSACDVASVREAADTVAHNQCQRDEDCPGGACIDEQCRSRTSAFQTVLFEVTPPADTSIIAGVQFLKEVSGLSTEVGAPLDLGVISQVSGKVTGELLKCRPTFVGDAGAVVLRADDLSLPARVSLIPAASALGLYAPRAVVQSSIVADVSWGFAANVPPGTYDIYVQPNRQPDQSCPVPPLLLRGKVIKEGNVPLDILLPQPLPFEFHVTWSGEGTLNGWMVDMLDPASGRTISNRVPLALGAGGKTDYVANVTYNSVGVVGKASKQQDEQWVRLSPPEDAAESLALPTVLLARSALGLFSANRGTLNEFSSLPAAVHVHGQVTSGITPVPAAATVTLVAKKITGIDPGVLASLVRTVDVGADGQFDVHLLPGTYRVSTVPLSPLDPGPGNEMPLAADTREWVVASTPAEQAGKVIELGSALPITGQVFDASGAPVAVAQVQAVPSPRSIQSDTLQEFLGGTPFVPRASPGVSSERGEFAFKADPGTFDITVRPNSDTGFAWLVLPNLAVTANSGVGLGRIGMPLPFSYRSTVTVPGEEGPRLVPGALVRAYIYLKAGEYTDDAVGADSVLQVGETRADGDGEFELLIPATLNRPAELSD